MPTVDAERGNTVAAGGVLLAVAIAMLDARLDASWANGVHLIVDGAAFAFLFGLALRSPLPARPLAYQSTLILSALGLLVLVLDRLAQVLGADAPFTTSGTLMWMAAIFALAAAYSARRFLSLGCAVLAGIGLAGFVVAFVDWAFDPSGLTTFRWVLFLLVVAFGAYAARAPVGEGEGYATPAVDVAGLLLIALAATFLASLVVAAVNPLSAFGGAEFHVGFGWKAILVIGSLAVIAYAAMTRERGPGWIGFVALLLTILIIANPTASDRTLVGWPLVLLLAAGAAFAMGLGGRPPPRERTRRPRPATEVPPPPL
jgi:hypothetical protein